MDTMDSKSCSDYSLISDSHVGESSSMDFSELTSVGRDFGEHFVDIIRATGISEDLLTSSDEINDTIQFIPGSEEFTDWFCKLVSVSNVVSEEELKVSERYKDVTDREIEEHLEDVFGKQNDTVKLTEETVNKLAAEETRISQTMEDVKKAKLFILQELKNTEQRTESLLQVITQTKSDIEKKINDILKVSNECTEESNNFFEKITKCGLVLPTETEEQGELKLFSQADLSNFNTKSTAVRNDLMASLSPLMQGTMPNEKETLIILAVVLKKYESLGGDGNETAKLLIIKYLSYLISSLESRVAATTSLNIVASQWHLINSVLSSFFGEEGNEITLASSIVDNLLSRIEMISQSELLTKCSSMQTSTSSCDSNIMLNDKISTLNEVLSGSKDFITIENFAQSLKELDESLTESEANITEYLHSLNETLIGKVNAIKELLRKISEKIEDPNGDLKMLQECNEKLVKLHKMLEQLNLVEDKKDVSSMKAQYENMMLLSITNPQLFKTKFQEIKTKIKLMEEALQS